MNLEQRFLNYKKDLGVGFDKLDIKLLKQSIAKIKEKYLRKKHYLYAEMEDQQQYQTTL